MKDYDINELTRELMIEHIPALEKQQVSFAVNIPDDEWLVTIDRMAYARILNNLLNNAIKHGKCSKIEIGIEKCGSRIVVHVSNNGTSIPSHELPLIFDRLYKCDASRSKSGNGLGLAIVRELTNAMSGDITAQSIPGGMTTFYLSFPFL